MLTKASKSTRSTHAETLVSGESTNCKNFQQCCGRPFGVHGNGSAASPSPALDFRVHVTESQSQASKAREGPDPHGLGHDRGDEIEIERSSLPKTWVSNYEGSNQRLRSTTTLLASERDETDGRPGPKEGHAIWIGVDAGGRRRRKGGRRRIEETGAAAAAAGEAVGWGLLRQRMRSVRVGLVLRGAGSLQQALQNAVNRRRPSLINPLL